MGRQFLNSVGYAWSASGSIPVDLNFLASASANMRAPEIEALFVRFTGSNGSGSSSLAGKDQYRVFSAVNLLDSGGVRCNLSGSELRIVEQLENGSGQTDTAAVSASTSFTVDVRLPLAPRKSRRPADFRIAVAELLRGGQLTITACPTTYVTSVTMSSGTYSVFAVIVDGGAREAKSRMCWQAYNATQAEDYYPVNGALRAAFVTAPTAAGGQTAVTGSTLDSTTLDLVAVPRSILVDNYNIQSSLNSAIDEFILGGAFPVVTPDHDQKILAMTTARRVHVKFDTAPASGSRIAVCSITDRVTSTTRQILGALDPARARLVTPKGKRMPAKLGPKASAVLPVRLV